MNEISELESQISDKQAVFHKPRNEGFIAFGEDKVYIIRDKEGFEFEEIDRRHTHSVLVSETEGGSGTRYDRDENIERKTQSEKPHTEIQITLKGKAVCVTVEECPKQVTRELMNIDISL